MFESHPVWYVCCRWVLSLLQSSSIICCYTVFFFISFFFICINHRKLLFLKLNQATNGFLCLLIISAHTDQHSFFTACQGRKRVYCYFQGLCTVQADIWNSLLGHLNRTETVLMVLVTPAVVSLQA